MNKVSEQEEMSAVKEAFERRVSVDTEKLKQEKLSYQNQLLERTEYPREYLEKDFAELTLKFNNLETENNKLKVIIKLLSENI
jgi:hypothetical protein